MSDLGHRFPGISLGITDDQQRFQSAVSRRFLKKVQNTRKILVSAKIENIDVICESRMNLSESFAIEIADQKILLICSFA